MSRVRMRCFPDGLSNTSPTVRYRCQRSLVRFTEPDDGLVYVNIHNGKLVFPSESVEVEMDTTKTKHNLSGHCDVNMCMCLDTWHHCWVWPQMGQNETSAYPIQPYQTMLVKVDWWRSLAGEASAGSRPQNTLCKSETKIARSKRIGQVTAYITSNHHHHPIIKQKFHFIFCDLLVYWRFWETTSYERVNVWVFSITSFYWDIYGLNISGCSVIQTRPRVALPVLTVAMLTSSQRFFPGIPHQSVRTEEAFWTRGEK